MPKTRSTALDTHKKSDVVTTAIIGRIVAPDGYVVAFSNSGKDIAYDDGDGSVTYKKAYSALLSNISSDATLGVDNFELTGEISDTAGVGVTADDVVANRFTGGDLYLMEINYKDLTMGHENVAHYKVGETTLQEYFGRWTMEMLSKATLLKQQVSALFSMTCRATFGDKRCKVVADWETGTNGVVSSVGGPTTTTFTDATLTLDDGHLEGVTITFTAAGANNGLSRQVTDYTGGVITLASALPEPITTSDTWTPENLNADMVVTGTVTSVTDDRLSFVDSSRAEADNYFVPGILTWTVGNNAGQSMEVKFFITKEFELVQPMYRNIQVGDQYSVRPDCAKTKTACLAYSNLNNFRGEPDKPLADARQMMTPGANNR